MVRPYPRCGLRPSVLLAALLSCFCPRAGLAALPPAAAAEPESGAMGAGGIAPQPQSIYALTPVRWGGRLNYSLRRDSGDDGAASQQSIGATLYAMADMPVWQPWFGKLTGSLNFDGLRGSGRLDYGSSIDNSGMYSLAGKSVVITGEGRLSLFPLSHFPFEAHFLRTDSRTSNTLSALDGYTNQRLGFSQQYRWAQGDASSQGDAVFSWDHDKQTSLWGDEYKQNIVQFGLNQNLGATQHLRLTGNGTRNTRGATGDLSELNALYLQHTFRPNNGWTGLTVDSTADISRSHDRLMLTGRSLTESRSRMTQFNSFSTWRPLDQPLTVNGGVRALTLESSWGAAGRDGNSSTTRLKNLNLNGGATYFVTKALQMSANASVNLADAAGAQTTSATESAGMIYTAEPIAVGPYQYLWTGTANVSNRSGVTNSGHQVNTQLSHSMNRTIAFGQGYALSAQAGQTASAIADSHDGSTRQLTHTGLLAWNASVESSSWLLQLNASDSRSWGTNPAFFQLANAQATGTLNSGRYSSWSGNLTIQATRQKYALAFDQTRPDSLITIDTGEKFVATSSGSLTYQNQRAFGVPRLLFVSDLRLNSQSLLPMVGGPLDRELGSWENRLEYTIGRLNLRFNTRLSRIAGRTNRALLISATRDFGN